MKRGYPDFFGYSTFPWEGDVLSQNCLVVAIAAGVCSDVFSLSARCVVKGGFLIMTSQTNPELCFVFITIDGEAVYSNSFTLLKAQGGDMPSNLLVRFLVYDPDNETYVIEITPRYTVGQSIAVLVCNNGGNPCDVSGVMFYTLVQ